MLTRRFILSAAGATAVLAAGITTGVAAPAAGSTSHPDATPTSMAYGSVVVTGGATPSGKESIFVFAPGAGGNIAPARTISGGATKLNSTGRLDLDRAGNIWAANSTSAGLIQKFAPTANGNAAPVRSFFEASNNDELPLGVAVTNDDSHVWIGNDGSGILSAYSTSASGATTPTQRITGSNTGISFSRDVALSPNGKHLFQTDGGNASVNEFATNGVENQAPVRTISLGDPTAHSVAGVTVDLAGNVWVSDTKTNALYEFGKSNTVPIRTIVGGQTGLLSPDGISLDAKGNVWVANDGDGSSVLGSVEAFSPTAHGNATPITRIVGTNTTLQFAQDVAVYGATPGAPRRVSVTGGKSGFHITWKSPSNTGGGLIGYLLERKVGKHAKWKVVATTHKPRHTDRFGAARPKPGHIYRYAAIAYNEFGVSGRSGPAKGKAKS